MGPVVLLPLVGRWASRGGEGGGGRGGRDDGSIDVAWIVASERRGGV